MNAETNCRSNRQDAASEYLPNPTETNGNGNGHAQKVFELAPVVSPDAIVQETVKKIAPQLRRPVHFSNLPAGVKFFFDAILDLSYMHCYGGSGRGKIFTSIRDLSRLLQHDRDTITIWRDRLIAEKLIWVSGGWPRSEWRICALCPAPDTDFRVSEFQAIQGKAASLEQSRNIPHSDFGAKPEDPTRIAEETGQSGGGNPARLAGSSGTPGGILRHTRPEDPARFDRKIPPGRPENPAHPAGRSRQACRKNPPSLAGNSGTNKETPMEIGSLGDKEKRRGPPPPKLADLEKIYWNGKHWWISQLHKQLSLLDQEIQKAIGLGKLALKRKRDELLVALGVKLPGTARTGSAKSDPSPPLKLPPKKEWLAYVAEMRKAVDP